MRNILILFLFCLPLESTIGDTSNDTENIIIIPSGPWLITNLTEVQSKNFTTATEYENLNANELKKVGNEKSEGKSEESTEENKNVSLKAQRKSRDSDKKHQIWQ